MALVYHFQISLSDIKILKSSVVTDEERVVKPSDFSSVKVGCKQITSFNLTDKSIRIIMDIGLCGVDEENSDVGVRGDFRFEYVFSVSNLGDYISDHDNSKKIDGNLGVALMSIAYSTSRGIIYEKIAGTFLAGSVIPVIDPSKLISESSE
jgi:hypothetical protein